MEVLIAFDQSMVCMPFANLILVDFVFVEQTYCKFYEHINLCLVLRPLLYSKALTTPLFKGKTISISYSSYRSPCVLQTEKHNPSFSNSCVKYYQLMPFKLRFFEASLIKRFSESLWTKNMLIFLVVSYADRTTSSCISVF